MIWLAVALAVAPSDPFTVDLGKGARLRLLAVSSNLHRRIWLPDGTPTSDPALFAKCRPFLLGIGSNTKALVLESTVPGSSPDQPTSSPHFLLPGEPDRPQLYEPKGTWISVRMLHISASVGVSDVSLLAATGPWKVAGKSKFQAGKKVFGSLFDPAIRTVYAPGRLGPVQAWTHVALPALVNGKDFEVMAYDGSGKPLPGAGIVLAAPGTYTCAFKGRPEDIKEIRVIVRPFRKVQFRKVHMQPSANFRTQ